MKQLFDCIDILIVAPFFLGLLSNNSLPGTENK